MAAMRMHPDQVDTDVDLVRRLLAGQHPQWADLPVEAVASYGTDHDIYRLGNNLAVRMPRIAWAAGQAAKEATWLPVLAPYLPLRIPVQLAAGQPAEGYPFCWSVYEWLPGQDVNGGLPDLGTAAVDLAAFIRALRAVDTRGAPARPSGARGAPLGELDEQVRRSVAQLDGHVDTAAVLRCWHHALDSPAWEGPEVWVHGDLLAGNLLVVDGRLSAVIDFGGLNVGDPACDLQPAWNVFPGASRRRFRQELDVDDASWARGRGWVLYQAVSALPYYRSTIPGIVRQATSALTRLLTDEDG